MAEVTELERQVSELEKLKAEIVSLECELEIRDTSLAASMAEVTELERQASRNKRDSEAHVRQLEANLQSVAQSERRQAETMAAQRVEIDQAEAVANALISERCLLRIHLLELQATSQAKHAEAEQRIEDLQNSLDQLEAERSSLAAELTQIETQGRAEATLWKQSLADAEASNKAAKLQMERLERDTQIASIEHRRQLQSAQEHQTLLSQQTEQLRHTLTERQRRLTDAEQALEQQSEQLATQRTATEDAQRCIAELTSERDALRHEFHACRSTWDQHLQVLEAAKDRAEAEKAGLITEYENELRGQGDRYRRLLDEREGVIAACKSIQEELAHARQSLLESEQRCEIRSSRISELEASNEELDATSLRLRKLTETLGLELRRQAAGRRKAEAALKRIAEGAEVDSLAYISKSQLEAQDRVERLTRELKATRQLCEKLRRRAIAQGKPNTQSPEQSEHESFPGIRKAG